MRLDIPLDNKHVIQHKDVASNRTDCGQLDVDQLISDAQQLRLKEDKVYKLFKEGTDVWLVETTPGGHPVLRKLVPNAKAQAQLVEEFGPPTPAPGWIKSVANVSELL